jgi:predicted dehydrogenase/threonine dehydrogenase-like Zn-dependent dehydrogenase
VKQVVRSGIKEIIVDEVPAPMLLPHHVLIRPSYSLISSGTETASIHSQGALHTVAEHPEHLQKIWNAFKERGVLPTIAELRAKFSEYTVLGYAGAGIVVEVHPTVRDLGPGDRVAYGGEGTGHGELILAVRNYVVKMPDDVSFKSACFVTLGSIALNAVRTANVQLGTVVVVEGLGLVGQLVNQLVQAQGGIVIGVDLRDDRLRMAKELGAHLAVRPDEALAAVNALTNGRGTDCVIVAAASKSPAAAHQALELCRERGKIVVVGAVELSFPWEQMYLKEIELLMSRAYGPGCYDTEYEKGGRDYPLGHVRWTANRNMEEFLRVVGSGKVRIDPLVSHEFPLEQAPLAYETIMNPSKQSLAVVLQYRSASNADGSAIFVSVPNRTVSLDSPRTAAKLTASRRTEFGAAMVGAGNLSRWVHLPLLKKTPGVILRAVHSTSGVRGKSYALRFGAAYCTTTYDEILRDPSVNVVVIATRNQEHAPQALGALRAGKHVFVEKPMGITEEECRVLCHEVEASDLYITIGFNRRFAPLYVEMKKYVARRAGAAVINCRVNSPGISGAYWMADPSIGGALIGEGCHFVDLMYWLLESEPVRVSAYSLPRGKQDPIGENNIAASFLFADGSVGNLTYSTVGSKAGGGERLEVFVPGMMITTENFKKFEVVASARKSKKFWFPRKGYAAQMRNFFDSIRSGFPPAITARDGARATLCCLRMLESAKSGRSCEINLEEMLRRGG